MSRFYTFSLFFVFVIFNAPLHAQSTDQIEKNNGTSKKLNLPEGINEDVFAPPPVPRFMLEQPAKPLTNEEMMKQVREAEEKAALAIKNSSTKP